VQDELPDWFFALVLVLYPLPEKVAAERDNLPALDDNFAKWYVYEV
jgi:hypothetical protein